MGFPSLDLYFRDLFAAFLVLAQSDDGSIINEVFADRPVEERAAARAYLANRQIITDFTDMDEKARTLFVVSSFIVSTFPFPQIGVYMGPEESFDFFLGNNLGVSEPVLDKEGNTVGFDVAEGYFSSVSFRADIIDNSKMGVIWLSRLCQRAIASKITELESMGVTEHRIGAVDTRIEQEHYPALVFSRAVTYSGRALFTWNRRAPAVDYDLGVNTAQP